VAHHGDGQERDAGAPGRITPPGKERRCMSFNFSWSNG